MMIQTNTKIFLRNGKQTSFFYFPLKPKRIVWNHNRPQDFKSIRRTKREAQRGPGFLFGGRPGFGFGHHRGHHGHRGHHRGI